MERKRERERKKEEKEGSVVAILNCSCFFFSLRFEREKLIKRDDIDIRTVYLSLFKNKRTYVSGI